MCLFYVSDSCKLGMLALSAWFLNFFPIQNSIYQTIKCRLSVFHVRTLNLPRICTPLRVNGNSEPFSDESWKASVWIYNFVFDTSDSLHAIFSPYQCRLSLF